MTVTYDFVGKIAVVTGGSRSIGRAIVERLARDGATAWAWDIAPLEFPGVTTLPVEVTNPSSTAAAVAGVTARDGRIVNMGSLAGKHGLPLLPVYSAASAGVLAFTEALGVDLAHTGIRVNAVAPAAITTDLILDMGPEAVKGFIAASPMKRLGTVAEVAEIVAWLCSEACSFNSGAVFDLSGGRAAY